MSINFLAVFVSMVISIVLGFIWYGPLFGKKWMALSGIPMPEQKPPMSAMARPIVLSLVGTFFMSIVLSRGIAVGNAYLGVSGAWAGVVTAFWCWLGFFVPPLLNASGWERKPWTLFWINGGYWLVLLAIVGAMISVWM
jgi:hypothetical protein